MNGSPQSTTKIFCSNRCGASPERAGEGSRVTIFGGVLARFPEVGWDEVVPVAARIGHKQKDERERGREKDHN